MTPVGPLGLADGAVAGLNTASTQRARMVARDVIALGAMATIPGTRDNDADDVSLALEVAQSQWTRGDYGEALKWLRKAADAAFDADQDQRGMELSKIAAELKAEIERPKPPPPKQKPPPPKQVQPRVAPAKPSAPPPRNTQRPAPRKPQKPEANLEVTGTRRTAHSTSGRKSSVHPKPIIEEDEATREYQLADIGPDLPAAAVVDEWPTETLDEFDSAGVAAGSAQKTGKPQQHEHQQKKKKPSPKAKKEVIVPSTRAIRVAVGSDKESVYVRLLDSQGLREGEHDAMLVALTSDGDIRELFR